MELREFPSLLGTLHSWALAHSSDDNSRPLQWACQIPRSKCTTSWLKFQAKILEYRPLVEDGQWQLQFFDKPERDSRLAILEDGDLS